MGWYLHALANSFNYAGRAGRAEFWTFALVSVLAEIAFAMLRVAAPTFAFVAYVMYSVATCSAGLAVTFRRLHDTGKSGGWALAPWAALVPVAIFLMLQRPSHGFRESLEQLAAQVQMAQLGASAFLLLSVILLVFCATEGSELANEYGDPVTGDPGDSQPESTSAATPSRRGIRIEPTLGSFDE